MIRSLYAQGSEAWYQEKIARITGTRFNDLMMGEGTKGYNELIANIAGEIITEKMEDTFKSALMKEGTEKEPEARAHLEDIIGEIEEVGFMMPEEDHKYHEWIGLSPDGLIKGERKYTEIKCPLKKTHLSYFLSPKKGPKDYRWQLQGGLWVMQEDYDSVYFCSYFPQMKPFVLEVFPDEEDFALIDKRLPITVERIQELVETYKTSDDYLMQE